MEPEDYQIDLLLDQCVTYKVVRALRARGFANVRHLNDTEMKDKKDSEILNYVYGKSCFVITSDRTFHHLLLRRGLRSIYIHQRSFEREPYGKENLAKMIEQKLQKRLKTKVQENHSE